ncbi:competence protein CoiA [Photobacterium sp. DNB22_13_2]
MPLRATLDGSAVQSFNYSSNEWGQLKSSYKSRTLTMACCGHKAIPKTSKLGTRYFAHARRGECTSAPETADHLKLKTIVAKAAEDAGWQVTTEFEGMTPGGEKWVADVYCQRGDKTMVFEVQWSHQSESEYLRRTEKYEASGINRVAWLYRDRANRDRLYDQPDSLPKFGFIPSDNGYVVPDFDVDIVEFVEGMFAGRLKWAPKKGDILDAFACYNKSLCLKCGGLNHYVCALEVHTKSGVSLGGELFDLYSSAREVIEANVSRERLLEYGIGSLDHIYNKRGGYAYMAHGCLHCNGVHCNHTYRFDYHTDITRSVPFSFRYDPALLHLRPKWCFSKSPA